MQSYTFRLIDTRTRRQASTVLTVEDEAHARKKAAVHLSASPYFSTVKILRGTRVVCTVDRKGLDALCRPIA